MNPVKTVIFFISLGFCHFALAAQPLSGIQFYTYKQKITNDMKRHCFISRTGNEDKWLNEMISFRNNKQILNNAIFDLKKNDTASYFENIKKINCMAHPPL